jgi:hypothetical protein
MGVLEPARFGLALSLCYDSSAHEQIQHGTKQRHGGEGPAILVRGKNCAMSAKKSAVSA